MLLKFPDEEEISKHSRLPLRTKFNKIKIIKFGRNQRTNNGDHGACLKERK